MNNITAVLETITPLFLGGADPRGNPELRAPSLRGAMRYWLRALLGGVYGDDDKGQQKINHQETEIFGSSSSGSNLVCQIRELTSKNINPVQLNPDQHPGEMYLLWASKDRKYIAQSSFAISIKPRTGGKMSHENFLLAGASFWLLLQFGGLGTRSRRLMGSLNAKSIEKWPEELPSAKVEGSEPAELTYSLADSIRLLRNLVPMDESAKFSPMSEFDILHPNHSAIYVWKKKWNDVRALIDDFGVDFQKQRFHKSPDDQAVLDVIHGNKSREKLERPGFGLPLQFFFRSELKKIADDNGVSLQTASRDNKLRRRATATLEPSSRDKEKTMSRRASPVHFHVTALNQGFHTIIATFFKSRFLPEHTQIRVKPGDWDQKPWSLDFGGYNLVEAYFKEQDVHQLNFSGTEVKP